jgi:hypothetical protein
VRRSLPFLVALALAGCSSGGAETVEVTTTLQVTTTVEGAPTTETTTGPDIPTTDPDDVKGRLDVRNLNATHTAGLLAVSLTTYEPWNSSVLAGPGGAEQGPNRITILYDVDLDGKADYEGRMIWAGGVLSLHRGERVAVRAGAGRAAGQPYRAVRPSRRRVLSRGRCAD